MLGILGGLFYFLIALGILVTIHELGHFLAAKACGVKVLRFSLGFGPVLFKKKGKDNCEYAVSAIPLGGYVKMEGKTLLLKIGVLYLKVHTNLKKYGKELSLSLQALSLTLY